MKIGIMQPYFFPYFGYFQLIHAVDLFVNLDHVAFMKRSYMVRNIIKNNTRINVPVTKGSQNHTCRETFVCFSDHYISRFLKKMEHLYSRESNYERVMHSIVIPNFSESHISIAAFNLQIIKSICSYLEINTPISESSTGMTDHKKEDGLKEITRRLQGDTYINAIGGQSLYSKEDFQRSNIELYFIQMGDVEFDNPFYSILHLLFMYDKEHIQSQLHKYALL